ncbi:phage/plasmid replication protein, II/X family [Psychrobacter sp. JB385]|uniref:phage/plasmid replication protein, II/X family n=1 Tax=Psychrobacter sp. JB385 TaxID=1434841 RepID=UPI00097F2703|nr:phage/plasmid replication protein, II/X family [Psychrobacter sp. JB385]SJN27175.1 Phage replication initiation protein \
MLDHLRISIPFRESCLTRVSDGTAFLNGNISDYGFEMASRHVEVLENGEFKPQDLYSPYDTLPSSFTGLAVKLFHQSNYSDPYVEIKASPAKLLQGHNVYGGESIGNAACEMLGILFQSIPQVAPFLNVDLATVRHLDVTYSSQVQNEKVIPAVIDYLSRIKSGQTKPTKNKKYSTTAYWGGETSRLVQLKCYAKHPEMLVQLEKFKKKAEAGDEQARLIVDTVYTDELLDFARKLMRWEARIKARKLERMGLPVGLLDLIKYQEANPNFLRDLWFQSFNPIFETFKGQAMPYATDNDLHELLKRKLGTITKAGRPSYTRANNAMNFFHLVRDVGLDVVKDRYSSSTYYDNLKHLTDAGLSKAWLENLHAKRKGDIVPLVNFTHVDFAHQFPVGYEPPISQFNLANVLAA